MHFQCSCCGACCSHLQEFGDIYADLDDGYGVCRFYNRQTHLCSCYENRPMKCRVEEGYIFFRHMLSFEEYLSKTREGCRRLQQL